MNGVQTWGEAITTSLIGLGERLINFLPALIGALLVLLAGWIIAISIGKLAEKFMKALRVDKAAEKIGLSERIYGNEIHLSISVFFGNLVKWFLVLVFLMAAADILKLDQVTNFLNSILLYIPNVIVAVVILGAVMLLGNFVYGIVKGSTRAAGIMSATLLATISKWAIVIFGIFAAFIQLGIAPSLVSTIFIGIVAMLALAGGLAFGLGGRDEAAAILRKLREEITENHK
ncbi:MAG: hypothetical protein A2271_00760 [Candidatus Moranbacteria bacterium RIFOXYA12_FULL_35_19]|nr:MAG: hypothetical protein A2343_01690 [Candidatus Moranbacteria bacterium RIFOXYB12_FULL_35_8]OGI33271.1 MAG: hypothetical protein A2489_01990 [Candidatus Moranbacteria bacterium RIFOXYC12_FULL_36_13]OGI36457.1 MAG: hypothetical protein A2271_00760 [Candidatus Moranbacteria bacterium RIFOXYA12_FULL_35_19]